MRSYISITTLFLIICTCCSCVHNKLEEPHSSNPQIKCGIANVTGKIEYLIKKDSIKEEKSYTISIVNPITMTEEKIDIKIDPNGLFQVSIPIEVSPTIAYFQSDNEGFLEAFFIYPDKTTRINIVYNKDSKEFSPSVFKNFSNNRGLIEELADHSYAFDFISKEKILNFIKEPSDYILFVDEIELKPKLKLIEEEKNISQFEKEYLNYATKLLILQNYFSFHSKMELYYNLTQEQGDTTQYITQILPKSYYTFLRGFDLNNTQYLYHSNYSQITKEILMNKTLALPTIGNTPIDQWLEKVKDVMDSLVDFDVGLFYDILISNAYALQFADEMRPLSNIQIKNIKEYFRGGEIEKIILRKNEEVKSFEKLWTPPVINKTPSVIGEKIVENIVCKYKGKPVVIDYWATWCVPCIQGIKKTKQMRMGMKNRDVVFVYITTESSPKEMWGIKIKEIGGEHYYLMQNEWNNVLNKYNFNSIPTYQFYDKEGKLQKQISGSISPEIMREEINLLLR